ncbi:L-tyrosine 3-hydroxylase [Amycolatopsis pithecellobii]|uniref:L-tyrosine 3-hydroxylase n=1 Tax=Amycolatopsis pithecellobii TaxID=664692 RepID=A0A6N7Z4I8_9PSEU|nr:L-tyrosine 3-hydroxylase [Amycolatopsis pithecellobii]MTD55220.1 L-tyrosine 3-hydroxylase [Amycolatopsis pithecellobii]
MTTPSTEAVHTAHDTPLPFLRLPMPTVPFGQHDGCATDGADHVVVPIPRLRHSEQSRAWFRWLLGHHLSVGVWRLQIEQLTTALDPRIDPEDAAKAQYAAAALYDIYSALLLYSGSCTQAVYADVIRARLKARHPAFSGTWARDYEHVLGLSRQLTGPTTTFKRAVRFDRHVHMAVGRRLVPAGKSLLRETGGDPRATTEEDRDRFDEFFLISREPVCDNTFTQQLTDRIQLALDDIATVPVTVDYGDDEDINRLQADIPAQLETLSSMVSGRKVYLS